MALTGELAMVVVHKVAGEEVMDAESVAFCDEGMENLGMNARIVVGLIVVRKVWKRILQKTHTTHSEPLTELTWIGICEPWDRSSRYTQAFITICTCS